MYKVLNVLVLLSAIATPSFAISVVEISNPIDGIAVGGPATLNTQYEYRITVGTREDLIQFNIGASDASTVQNIQGPGNGGVFNVMQNAGSDNFTPHGSINLDGAPDFVTTPFIIGWVPQVGAGVYYFGFDAPGSTVRDSGWTAAGISATPGNEVWTQPVGTGLGPVHAPGPRVPEPSSILLAGIGLAAVSVLGRR